MNGDNGSSTTASDTHQLRRRTVPTRQPTGPKYPDVDCNGSRGVMTSSKNKRDKDRTMSSTNRDEEQIKVASDAVTSRLKQAPVNRSVWGSVSGRMPNYAAPTVASQTRSVIHATSQRDLHRRHHHVTSPVTSPRVHICPRFRLEPDMFSQSRPTSQRSRSVDTRVSRTSLQSVSAGKVDATSTSSRQLSVSTADSRQRSRSADNRREPVNSSTDDVTGRKLSRDVISRPAAVSSVIDSKATRSRALSVSVSVSVQGVSDTDTRRRRTGRTATRDKNTKTTTPAVAATTTITPATAQQRNTTHNNNQRRTKSTDCHGNSSSSRRPGNDDADVSDEYRLKLQEKRRQARQQQQLIALQRETAVTITTAVDTPTNTSDTDHVIDISEPSCRSDTKERAGDVIELNRVADNWSTNQLELDDQVKEQDKNSGQLAKEPDVNEQCQKEQEEEKTISYEDRLVKEAQARADHIQEELQLLADKQTAEVQLKLEAAKREQEQQDRLEKARRDEEDRLERKRKLALIMQRVKSAEGPTSPKLSTVSAVATSQPLDPQSATKACNAQQESRSEITITVDSPSPSDSHRHQDTPNISY